MDMRGDEEAGERGELVVRPQALLLTLFGDHVLDRGVAVSTGSVVAVLERLGVGEHATRTAVARMVRRDLLGTVRRGRRVFLGLTRHGGEVLRDGRHRLTTDVVDSDWDGRWTLLSFSVPEARRADRHALRKRLGWLGFAPLRSGVWVSPGAADVERVLAELDLLDHAEVFRAEAAGWTDPARIVREAWDLPAIEADYRAFLSRWEDGTYDALDVLCRRVRLTAEWLLLVRQDPRLPASLLPAGWPGVVAQRRFRALHGRLVAPSVACAERELAVVATG
ncbi:PaaX family transcriptional regulator [Streptomyces sedi]|nr:PaaX family transcriptional regulator C-terminal domain-containing protein [Streptomyces sedi]